MAINIRRRKFIVTLGGAAVACPLAVSAQQAGKVWRIGFLSAVSRESGSRSYVALQQGMRELEHFPVALNQGDSQVLSLRRV
jgi:hypothetical protein